jgi:hypothetical protein
MNPSKRGRFKVEDFRKKAFPDWKVIVRSRIVRPEPLELSALSFLISLLLLIQSSHHVLEINQGDKVVALCTGKVSSGLDQIQLRVIHIEPGLDPIFVSLFSHGQKAFGLGHGAREGLNDLTRLPDGIACVAHLQSDSIQQLGFFDLQG